MLEARGILTPRLLPEARRQGGLLAEVNSSHDFTDLRNTALPVSPGCLDKVARLAWSVWPVPAQQEGRGRRWRGELGASGEMERPCFPPSWRCILQKFRMLHMESMQANHGAPGLQFNSRLGEPVERKGGPSSMLRAWLACLFVSACVAWHVQVSGKSVGDACALPVSQGKC